MGVRRPPDPHADRSVLHIPELFATAFLFGALAFAFAWTVAGDDRPTIRRTALLTLAAYAIVGALVFVPYVLPAIENPPIGLVRPLGSADLLASVVPRDQTLIGGSLFAAVSDRFTARVSEDGSYLGIAGALLLIGFGITERRRRSTWALLAFVGAGMVLSWGSVLRIAGRPTISMPGAVLAKVPLVKYALPDRFAAYTAVAVGVIAAIWLARAHGRGAWVRWGLVLVTAALMFPNVRTPPWHFEDRTPAFFSTGTFAAVLYPDETVLLISGAKGESLLWQATADFRFRMPWAYIGTVPAPNRDGRLTEGLFVEHGHALPSARRFSRSLAQGAVTAVVLGDLARPVFEPLVRSAGLEPVYEGEGVSVWR